MTGGVKARAGASVVAPMRAARATAIMFVDLNIFLS
jgi:hypothetical protein